jgi:hypothetical protein
MVNGRQWLVSSNVLKPSGRTVSAAWKEWLVGNGRQWLVSSNVPKPSGRPTAAKRRSLTIDY